jgi:hypothetical protein
MTNKWKNTFRVGIYKCEMTYSKNHGLHAKWLPKMPGHREFSQQEMAQYRSGRDNLIAEVAKTMGGSALIIET